MKRLFIFIISVFLSTQIFALSPEDFSFYVQPSIGFTEGQIGEYLYAKNSDRVISYLQWQEQPLVNGAIDLGVNLYNFNLEGFVSAVLPVYCGQMTDSDWKKTDVKTNYGIFENSAGKNINLTGKISYDFFINNFTLSPVVAVNFRYMSFTARNGYGWYGENKAWNSEEIINQPPKKLSGIDYYRRNIIVLAGLKTQYSINNFRFGLELDVSPFAVFYAQDYHRDDNVYAPEDEELRQDYITLMVQNGFFQYYSAVLTAEYICNNQFSLVAAVKGDISPILKGQTATNAYRGINFGLFEEDPEFMMINQKSGTDTLELSFSFGVKFNF